MEEKAMKDEEKADRNETDENMEVDEEEGNKRF